MNKKLLALVAGAALITAAQTSSAGMLGAGSAAYNITLADSCTTASSWGTAFGTYATTAPDLTNAGAGGISVDCPSGMAYRIMVDGGGNPSAGMRYMANGLGNFMAYRLKDLGGTPIGDANPIDMLYTPVYNAAPWANGIDGNGAGTFWLLADVLISSSPVAGAYNDAVGVTVTW